MGPVTEVCTEKIAFKVSLTKKIEIFQIDKDTVEGEKAWASRALQSVWVLINDKQIATRERERFVFWV